ncbi:ArsR/SmtB family transcription factor [Methyloraptor flagellatus]|uniref:SRPBCC domain-containing protein n=1 Tax=Methyloraptor flagellatus TaxID=3162530 RepID=A0AAU7XHK9_9HYPH
MDDIFEALAHPIRRALLDALREKDGQRLADLERGHGITRFGVMKHLRILEAAHLVVTRKVGREKLHYLNPVPIQQAADRWISRYAAPFARTLNDLSRVVEGDRSMADKAPKHVWELFVRATPAAIWAILTDDAKTPLWQHFNMTSQTDWRPGGAITFFAGDRPMIVGAIVALEPPHRLVHSFSAQWSPDVASDLPSRVTWELVAIGDSATKIVLTHDDFAGETATSKAVGGGWPEALSRLKTLVETGEPFIIPAPSAA